MTISASLFSEGKLLIPITAPNGCQFDIEVDETKITMLSGFNKNGIDILAVELPSPILQLSKLMAVSETFVNSTNSVAGKPIEGVGAGHTSVINIECRAFRWALIVKEKT